MAWPCTSAAPKPWSHCGWKEPDTTTSNCTASTWNACVVSLGRNWPHNTPKLSSISLLSSIYLPVRARVRWMSPYLIEGCHFVWTTLLLEQLDTCSATQICFLMRFLFFSRCLSSPCACVCAWELWGIEVEFIWSKKGWTNSSASFSPKERSQPDGVSQYLSIHLSVERFASLTCSHDASA